MVSSIIDGVVAVILGVLGYFQAKNVRTRTEWERKADEESKDNAERLKILIEASTASLDGLHQQGCNGRVTEAIKTLEDYKSRKASS